MEKELKLVQEIYPDVIVKSGVMYIDNIYIHSHLGNYSLNIEAEDECPVCYDQVSIDAYICLTKDFSKILTVLKAIQGCQDD